MKFEISANEFRSIVEKTVTESYIVSFGQVQNYISPNGKKFVKTITKKMYEQLKEYNKLNKSKDKEMIEFDLGEKN